MRKLNLTQKINVGKVKAKHKSARRKIKEAYKGLEKYIVLKREKFQHLNKITFCQLKKTVAITKQLKDKRSRRSLKKLKFKADKSQLVSILCNLKSAKYWIRNKGKEELHLKSEEKIPGKSEYDIMILKCEAHEAENVWKSKFRRAESIRWKRFLIGCRARNGYYDECPKYSLTSLNGGECQILQSSFE